LSGLRQEVALLGVGSPLTKIPICEPEGGKGANPAPHADERNLHLKRRYEEMAKLAVTP